MLFTAMPNRNKVPIHSLPLSPKGSEHGWRTAQNSSIVLNVGNCPFGFALPYGKNKNRNEEPSWYLHLDLNFRSTIQSALLEIPRQHGRGGYPGPLNRVSISSGSGPSASFLPGCITAWPNLSLFLDHSTSLHFLLWIFPPAYLINSLDLTTDMSTDPFAFFAVLLHFSLTYFPGQAEDKRGNRVI